MSTHDPKNIDKIGTGINSQNKYKNLTKGIRGYHKKKHVCDYSDNRTADSDSTTEFQIKCCGSVETTSL